ncbi:hypothetical protein CEUSTIGMA_g11465.t1 [Chlamydomonas eustigma]|uniref:Phosphoglycolate phosphatase n=1 Tax=Chlamydomonas eustigma TaxID=1157962 RepID=A0A250XLR7_9CHLO|nr:hypothetical protein CEUSTIGMA_g11465.t1 [Chlamydomonas eustigma]|eukprot:GAX84041.1 hypothetical protein CEUSTIGMA_g11465.t1 [Chlamydomonas eustigma]
MNFITSNSRAKVIVHGRKTCHFFRLLSAKATPFNESDLHTSFLIDINTLLFDCDGVIWKGSHIIPGASEALTEFRKRGKRLLFVSNNSSKSRVSYIHKFQGLGIHGVECEDVISSSYAVAAYLKSIGFKKKVFLIGNKGLEEELQKSGISYVGWETAGEGLLSKAGSLIGDANSISDWGC